MKKFIDNPYIADDYIKQFKSLDKRKVNSWLNGEWNTETEEQRRIKENKKKIKNNLENF